MRQAFHCRHVHFDLEWASLIIVVVLNIAKIWIGEGLFNSHPLPRVESHHLRDQALSFGSRFVLENIAPFSGFGGAEAIELPSGFLACDHLFHFHGRSAHVVHKDLKQATFVSGASCGAVFRNRVKVIRITLLKICHFPLESRSASDVPTLTV